MREEVPAVIQTKRRKCAIGDLKKIATPEKVEVFRYLLAARTLHQSKKSDLDKQLQWKNEKNLYICKNFFCFGKKSATNLEIKINRQNQLKII